jgi:S-adenosylmethionine:tRNA ribosyltransferase-isomerase
MTQPDRQHTLADFDFALPEALIAQHPTSVRSASRLLDGRSANPADRIFRDLPELLNKGDLLVFNDTEVVKARLYGEKKSGGKLELLIERVLPDNQIAAHMKVSKKPAIGARILLDGGSTAVLLGRWPNAESALFHFQLDLDPHTLMRRHGHVPLPPYITHGDTEEDIARYQTIFAAKPGAAAAPTAALHFDEAVLTELYAKGVQHASVTLHVGAGTFSPVKTENIHDHKMHSEWYEVPQETVDAIAACKARGGRVVAVGTTTIRTLESAALGGVLTAGRGDTDIFITPGFHFNVADILITNFHLPKSTLLMLVSAFAGYDQIRALYAHAIKERYRFFSYGDAMLLERTHA